MYKVYLDDNLMYCPSVPSLFLESLELNLELNATNVCDFLILPENLYYNKIKKRKSIIKIYDDNYRVFRGLVQDTKKSFYNGQQVTCEGEMAFLRDSIQRPYEFKCSVEKFFTFLIEEHNKQVDESRQFHVGKCTVKALDEDTMYSDSQYMNTWESLQKKLLDELGGYLWTREEEDGVYIDYLEDFETLNGQTVEFGKNLLDFEEAVKGADVKTAIIPLGCKMKDENDKEYRLDIKSVNQGVDYVFSEEAVKKYGLIFEKIVWDDVAVPEELLRKGNEELQNYVNLSQSIEIQAVNLHSVNKDIRSFRLGNYTKVISKLHNIDEVMLTRKLDLDLLDPASGTLFLGDERKAFVDQQVDNNSTVGGIIEKVNKMDQFDESVIHEIYEAVNTTIQQASDSVIIQVGKEYYSQSEMDGKLESVSTKYEQLNDQFLFEFNKFTKDLEDVQSGTDAKFQDVSKYIRFVDGTILLGQAENAFQVQIKHNRISFLENNVEVAYIADRKIYITDGEFINSLKIGSFAFRPRKNGNLSFGRVV